jgi:hypothetical protein
MFTNDYEYATETPGIYIYLSDRNNIWQDVSPEDVLCSLTYTQFDPEDMATDGAEFELVGDYQFSVEIEQSDHGPVYTLYLYVEHQTLCWVDVYLDEVRYEGDWDNESSDYANCFKIALHELIEMCDERMQSSTPSFIFWEEA